MRDVMRKILALLQKDERWWVLRLFIMMIIMAILQVIGIALVLPFMALVIKPDIIVQRPEYAKINDFLHFSSNNEMLIVAGIAVFVMLLASNSFAAYASWRQMKFVSHINHTLSARVLSQYLHQPYAFFLQRNVSSLSATVLNSVNAVIVGALLPGLTFFTQAFSVVFILALLMVVNPLLSLLAAAVFGSSYIIIYLSAKRKLTQISQIRVSTQRKRHKVVNEVFGGIRDVMVLNKQKVFVNDYHQASKQFADSNATVNTITLLPRHALEVFVFGGAVLAVLFFLVSQRDVSEVVPMLALYSYAGYRIMPALQQMFTAITNMRSNRGYVETVYKDLVEIPEQTAGLSADQLGEQALPFKACLRFNHINFNYASSTDVAALTDINLAIRHGSITAIAGTTGAGKTTLLDLMLALLQPTSGDIMVDDSALTPENANAWRLNVGYVPQNAYLCNDSVRHNIAFGIAEDKIDEEAIIKAAKIAQLHDFIVNDLKKGYDTVIGNQGTRLSGGQRQRVSIARALYRNPDVLFFDEATSALDSVTEKKIIDAIHTLKKTVVIITHRLASIKQANKIILIDKGVIIAEGTYNALFNTNAIFREMAVTNEEEQP